MTAPQAAPLPWTASRLGGLADDLDDLQAAHGTVQAVTGGDTVADLVGRLVGVLECLAADVHVAQVSTTLARPGRPVLTLLPGGAS